jgi:hypothetical protein
MIGSMATRSRFVVRVLLFTLFGCLSDDVAYSPEQDDDAMTSITQSWSSASMTMSLCEDIAAIEDDNTCQVAHVVRGGGRGKRHVATHGGGCGGCPFANVAYVKGTVTGSAGPMEVVGEVSLASHGNDDPYEFPYDIDLRCTSTESPCSIGARLLANGTIEVIDPNDYRTVIDTLAPAGAAACP